MSVFLRDGVWYVYYYDEFGKRRRRSTRTADRRVADRIDIEIRRDVELRKAGINRIDTLVARQPIARTIDMYIDGMRRRLLDGMYIANTRRLLTKASHLSRWRTLSDVNQRDVQHFLDATTSVAKTYNNSRSILFSFCKWCCQQDPPYMLRNPVEHVPTAKARLEKTRRHLNDDEVRMLLACPAPSDGRDRNWPNRLFMYAMMIGTGIRKKEARGLVVRNLHLEDVKHPFLEIPETIVKASGSKVRARRIPIQDEWLLDLARNWIEGRSKSSRLFPTVPTEVTVLHRDCRRAGFDPVHDGLRIDYHGLRYTFGTRLALNDVPITVVQKLMGHQDINTTMKIYVSVGLDDAVQHLRHVPPMRDASN